MTHGPSVARGWSETGVTLESADSICVCVAGAVPTEVSGRERVGSEKAPPRNGLKINNQGDQ